jgi:hypothetical protein
MALHFANDELGMHILRHNLVHANSFVHSHSTIVLAMGDQEGYRNLRGVIDRRDLVKELSDFWDGLVAILASACCSPDSRSILQE